jgi:hypothetical protein
LAAFGYLRAKASGSATPPWPALTSVLLANADDVFFEREDELAREEGSAIVTAFAVANDDMHGAEVDVFDTKARALEDAKTSTVK